MNSNYSLKKYLHQKQIELSDSISGKKLVYLDTNYWIKLKEQSLKTEVSERKLFDIACNLIDSQKVLFPISEITYWEVLKRTDLSSLKQTIEIIDKFSKGIALVNGNEIMRLEFKYYLNSLKGNNVEKIKKLYWTKLPFVAYPNFIEHPGFRIANNPFINTVVFDRFWNSSFSQIFDILVKDPNYQPFVFKDNVEYFNTEKKNHENENNTFEQMFLSELGGAIDLFDSTFCEVIAEHYLEETGEHLSEEYIKENGIKFRDFVFYSFKSKKIQNELPSLRIFFGLFANTRWNKTYVHRENDTMDFKHASCAVPYCDYFFTEKGLGTALIQNHLAYDKLYSCTVQYKETDVLNTLYSIL